MIERVRTLMSTLRSTIVVAVVAASIVAVTANADATFPGTNGELAYLRGGYGGYDHYSLRTINADGSHGDVLWAANQHIGSGFSLAWPWEADWSPDGSIVALVARGDTLGDDRLLIGDPATRERSVVLRIRRLDDHAFFASIAFAPTGDAVLFCAVSLGDETSVARLYTIGVDGSNVSLVSDRPECFADWSSANRVVAAAGDQLNKIVTMNPDGTDRNVIVPRAGGTAEGTVGGSPSWSPDGSRLAYSFTAGARGHYELFSVAGDGSRRIRLTDTPRRDEIFPVFSPDAAIVAFTRSRSFNRYQSDLYTVTSDGATVRRLTDTRRADEYADSWRSLP
jgi:Tol biopolymer transport system component